MRGEFKTDVHWVKSFTWIAELYVHLWSDLMTDAKGSPTNPSEQVTFKILPINQQQGIMLDTWWIIITNQYWN